MTRPASPARQVAVAILGIASILVWLTAGYPILVSLVLMPDPGQETLLRALQVVTSAGWVLALLWLLRDVVAGTLRFLLAPAAAWFWTYGMFMLTTRIAHLNVGY